MKIKDLVKILAEENDPEKEIVMSKDSEGNAFSPLADVGDGLYASNSTYSGEVYNLDEKEDAGEGAKQVLVLWPTN